MLREKENSYRTEACRMYSGPMIDEVWPKVAPHVRAALAFGHGEYLSEDILAGIFRGDFQLWVPLKEGRPTGACVTEMVAFPRKNILNVVLFAGSDLETSSGILPHIEAFAELVGACEIRGGGRVGWEKILPKYGFEKLSIVMSRRVLRSYHA
jgi:hypothetical protein